MNKTVRYVLYAVVSAICVIAVFIGVFSFIIKKSEPKVDENYLAENKVELPTQEEVKDEFKDLFTNNFFDSNLSVINIAKLDDTKDLVYEGITLDETKANLYSMKLHIPVININSEIATGYNDNTQQVFVTKANEIMQSATSTDSTLANGISNGITQNTASNEYTIYDISYTAYVNNNILSVAIMASLKQGNSAQRIIVQTYNYDLVSGKEVTINDIISSRGLDTNVVNKRINAVVKKAYDNAKSLSETGYDIYQRDLTSDMYNVENVNTFIQGPNGELYIIYAYGNSAFTSEMDVIKI